MQTLPEQSTFNVALLSTPWPLFSRPSIQLGTLKSFLKARFSDVGVDAHPVYLKVAAAIGYPLYQTISERTWLAESVYGALLYPENFEAIQKVFRRQTSGKPELQNVSFQNLIARVAVVSDRFIQSVQWNRYGIAGFSVCLCQLTSSLYFARQIKKQFPALPVVIGGSTFAGETARSTFEAFPEIDIIVNGEGEIPLSRLVNHLKDGGQVQNIPLIPGVVTAETAASAADVSFNQMQNLNDLGCPDYDDYFELLRSLGAQNAFFPTLPAEMSRGCWWRRAGGTGEFAGCAFCNLNLQWQGYRYRDPGKVAAEIDHLTTRHKTLSVAFTDNLLPHKGAADVFRRLSAMDKDFRMFGEIRATTPKSVLADMQSAGMHELQIGIEALSTRLLNKLNKGTTAIENLEIMKHCESLGIVSSSNLILYFPGSDPQDVAETLRCLEFAFAFRPLKPVRFWLGYGSPVFRNPKAFGLKAVYNHPNYGAIFPEQIHRKMRFTIQAYRGDLGYQKQLWRPVKNRLQQWQKTYAELHQGPLKGHILSYRDGRDFLIIHQKRPQDKPMIHRLEKTSRAIYLFCEHHRTIKNIVSRFQGMPEDKILPFLKMMVEKKLMFEENGKYLSLAVPARSNRR